MRSVAEALVFGFLVCAVASGQTRYTVMVCDTTAVNNVNDCYYLDSSTIGRVKFEDYRVTNPAAVQFDPAQRLKELAALGSSTTAALCRTPPAFVDKAPSITFDKTSVSGQIYWVPVGPSNGDPFEFMDVQFSNFAASNGFTSPRFGFRMIREITKDGVEVPQYQIQIQPGNPGLENVAGIAGGVGFRMDPLTMTATGFGAVPSSDLLRGAMYGVFVNAQAVLDAAKFTVTVPAPSGRTLWSGSQLNQLTGQASPWISAAQDALIPLPPPLKCGVVVNGYSTCLGADQVTAFNNMLLLWGGEYLGMRTTQSFDVLVRNLRAWASANAITLDPGSTGPPTVYSFMIDVTKDLAMLWPTLRDDPALSPTDRQLIENWIVNHLVARPGDPDFFSFPNDLGEFGASTAMADAIRRSDHLNFAFGIQRFYGSLIQMRPDGSFPLSARLSACSAVYSDIDIAHLVSIAEMAATQGYDLYSLSVNGKSIETAIEYYLDAHDNPALLAQYSKAGGGGCFEGSSGDPPDFSLVFAPGNVKYLAWMEAYLARFPYSPTAARIRKILGSNVAAAPFPLMISYTGLNATCAFRKLYEFQPVNGAKVSIVSGDGQTVSNQVAAAPLSVRVTDNSGKVLAGVLVSFAITQGSANLSSAAQVLTDASGTASATVAVAGGPVVVTATALGVSTKFSLGISGPAIYSGGIVGIGGSVPAVATISSGALFSVYGQNFVPAGTGRRVSGDELVNGVLPNNLLGVCVSVGGQNAPLLDVYPGQINAVAPLLTPLTTVDVIVTTGCGTQAAVRSVPEQVTVAAASQEFLYFANHADGQNPVAAVNSQTGLYVGPADLGASFTPARAGDIITIFASGFGPNDPAIAPGSTAIGPLPIKNKAITVRLGSVTLDPKDVLYVGAAPGQLISQLNIRIPQGVPAGNQPIQIRIGSVASPPGAYMAIAAP